jgi:hypothetical protein
MPRRFDRTKEHHERIAGLLRTTGLTSGPGIGYRTTLGLTFWFWVFHTGA